MSIAEAEAKEKEAVKLLEEAGIIRSRAQEQCTHPYEWLSFRYGVTTSFYSDRVEHSMEVQCALCKKSFSKYLTEYKQL